MATFARLAAVPRPPQPCSKWDDAADPMPSMPLMMPMVRKVSDHSEEDSHSTSFGSTPSFGSVRSPSPETHSEGCWDEHSDDLLLPPPASRAKDNDYVEVDGLSFSIYPGIGNEFFVDEDSLVPDLHPSSLCTPLRSGLGRAPTSELEMQDWCGEADLSAIEGLSCGVSLFRLIGARVVHTPLAEAQALYEEMGMRDPRVTYAIVWINLANTAVVLLAALPEGATERQKPEEAFCLLEDFLLNRLHLVVNCLQLQVPLSWTGPRNIERMGSLFQRNITRCKRSCNAAGVDHLCLDIDLNLTPLQAKALEVIGFRQGNVVELLVVERQSKLPFTACRLTATGNLLQLLN